MDLIKLRNQIEEEYRNDNYQKALESINKYLSYEDSGIFARLLHIWINSEIRLGLLDAATKNLNVVEKLFPNYYSVSDLALKYAACGKIDRLLSTLKGNKFAQYDLYNIAKECFLVKQYNLAEYLFKKLLALPQSKIPRNSLLEYLRKIELYKTNKNIFRQCSYSKFLSLNQTLEPGYIVCVSSIEDNSDETIKENSHSYLVWEITDSKITAFPISTIQAEEDSINISLHECPNFPGICQVKPIPIRISKNKIRKVIEKVNPESLELLKKEFDLVISQEKECSSKKLSK